jgi:hypothetical protein
LAKWAELGIVGPGEFPSLFLFIFYFFSFFSIFKSKFEFKFKFITTTYVCGFRGINSGYILFIYIIYIFHIIVVVLLSKSLSFILGINSTFRIIILLLLFYLMHKQ